MIHRLKDTALSKSIHLTANSKWKRFGKILDLRLDTRSRSIEMELLPKGEKEPILLKVFHYEITDENGKHWLRAERIQCSREWIDLLGNEYLSEHPIEIPAHLAQLLKKVL